MTSCVSYDIGCYKNFTTDKSCVCCPQITSTYHVSPIKYLTKIDDVEDKIYVYIIGVEDDETEKKFFDDEKYNNVVFKDTDGNIIEFESRKNLDKIKEYGDSIIYINVERKISYSTDDTKVFHSCIIIITKNMKKFELHLRYNKIMSNNGYKMFQPKISNSRTSYDSENSVAIHIDSEKLLKIAKDYVRADCFCDFILYYLNLFSEDALNYENLYKQKTFNLSDKEHFKTVVKCNYYRPCKTAKEIYDRYDKPRNSCKIVVDNKLPTDENIKLVYFGKSIGRILPIYDAPKEFVDKMNEFNQNLKNDEYVLSAFGVENSKYVMFITNYYNIFYHYNTSQIFSYKIYADYYCSSFNTPVDNLLIKIITHKYFGKYGYNFEIKEFMEIYKETIQEYKEYILKKEKEAIQKKINNLKEQVELLEKSE